MDARTEQEILNNAYQILEQDNSYWDENSSEYETARGILGIGINRWQNYDNTIWKELFQKLSVATGGDKTISAATYSYDAPDRFSRCVSWVRTIDSAGQKRFWRPIPPQKLGAMADDSSDYCYFLGNKKDGFTLNFNAKATLPAAGNTIEYELYILATQTTATGDEVELANPAFLVYHVAAHMADGGIDQNFFQIAEALLKEMKETNDDDNFFDVSNDVEWPIDEQGAFGR